MAQGSRRGGGSEAKRGHLSGLGILLRCRIRAQGTLASRKGLLGLLR